MWFDLSMIACGLVVILGVCGLLVDRWWLVWDWWPLVGWEWRAERANPRPAPHQPGSPMYPPGSPLYDPDEEYCQDCQTLCTDDRPCMCCHVDNLERDEDDKWAEDLHAINVELKGRSLVYRGQFGDLSRPIHQLTHYEIEAVIVQLGHADWLPAAA